MGSKIIGSGSYLPEKVLSNFDLEKIVDTSNEWIVTRTGMQERRIAEHEHASQMGFFAAKKALEDSGILAEDIECIIVATCTPDYQALSTACLIQNEIGATNASAMDVQATCSGYLYGIFIANAFIKSNTYKNVLVIATEKLSTITNYQDRSTCILFGDGAAACVVSGENRPGFLIKDLVLGADGKYNQSGFVPAGGSRMPTSKQTLDQNLHYIHMSGNEIFKLAVRKMEEICGQTLVRSGLSLSDIDWLVPHQANLRIIEALAKRFGMPMDKVCVTLKKFGNTSASSIGIALDTLIHSKKIKPNQNLLLSVVGFGLTWGAGILTYSDTVK